MQQTHILFYSFKKQLKTHLFGRSFNWHVVFYVVLVPISTLGVLSLFYFCDFILFFFIMKVSAKGASGNN